MTWRGTTGYGKLPQTGKGVTYSLNRATVLQTPNAIVLPSSAQNPRRDLANDHRQLPALLQPHPMGDDSTTGCRCLDNKSMRATCATRRDRLNGTAHPAMGIPGTVMTNSRYRSVLIRPRILEDTDPQREGLSGPILDRSVGWGIRSCGSKNLGVHGGLSRPTWERTGVFGMVGTQSHTPFKLNRARGEPTGGVLPLETQRGICASPRANLFSGRTPRPLHRRAGEERSG